MFSNEEKHILKIVALAVSIIIIGVLFYACSPIGRGIVNINDYAVHKVDDISNYKTLKEVENTARAMIASYEGDRLMYEQYKNSDNDEVRAWSLQAKNRANRTATTYNNYILKNKYIWKDAIPSDIKSELEFVE